MTTGYPAEATTDAVQANIVAARYDVQTLSLSRATTYTGRSTQDLTETFTNTTAVPALGLRLSISGPNQQWISVVAGSPRSSATFADPIAPGASVSATFRITAPAATGAGVLTGNAEWAEAVTGGGNSRQRRNECGTSSRSRSTSPLQHRAPTPPTSSSSSSTPPRVPLTSPGGPLSTPEPMGSGQPGENSSGDQARARGVLSSRRLQFRTSG